MIAAVETDQGVGVLVVILLVGRGPDRRKDEPVVVVGVFEEDLETIPRSRQSGSNGYSAGSGRTSLIEVEVVGAQCIAVSCVGRM